MPDPADVGWLIVLGGPMSANDEHLYAWLSDEKAFIGEAIRAGKRVLGHLSWRATDCRCIGRQGVSERGQGNRVVPNVYHFGRARPSFQVGARVIGLQFHLETTGPCTGGSLPSRFAPGDICAIGLGHPVGTRRALQRSKRPNERGASLFGRNERLTSRRTGPVAARRSSLDVIRWKPPVERGPVWHRMAILTSRPINGSTLYEFIWFHHKADRRA